MKQSNLPFSTSNPTSLEECDIVALRNASKLEEISISAMLHKNNFERVYELFCALYKKYYKNINVIVRDLNINIKYSRERFSELVADALAGRVKAPQ